MELKARQDSFIKLIAISLLLAIHLCVMNVNAEETLPKELQGITITEQLGKSIDISLEFINSKNEKVNLSTFLGDDKPLLLTLNYYECPTLCSLMLKGLLDALKKFDWTPGKEFRIVTVSIDPREKSGLAAGQQDSFLKEFGREGADWQFLVGEEPQIQALAR